ncbi:TPA: hypothetical protein ACH3X1_011045 [Trebouxia sp. C0004]
MYNVQPERVRQWDRAIQSQGSLTFADWKTVALDSSEVMQDAEELTEWRNKMEGVAEKAQGRGQGLAARLAASGTRAHADSSRRQKQWALQPCHPRDEPKACPSVFTCLSHVLLPSGGVGVLDAPGEPDMPPGFDPILSASTGKGRGPMRMPNLDEAFGDRQMVPKLVGLAEQLGKLHGAGLVH